MRRLIALSTMAVLGAAAPAAAQDPVPPPATTPEQTPPPPPAAGQMTVVVDKVGKQATVLVRQRWRVRGNVAPYVAGQEVAVRFYRDGKKILARRAKVKPGATGAIGHFKVPFKTNLPGKVTVRVTKVASATQVGIKAPPQQVLVLPDHAPIGARCDAVPLLQRPLT